MSSTSEKKPRLIVVVGRGRGRGAGAPQIQTEPRPGPLNQVGDDHGAIPYLRLPRVKSKLTTVEREKAPSEKVSKKIEDPVNINKVTIIIKVCFLVGFCIVLVFLNMLFRMRIPLVSGAQ